MRNGRKQVSLLLLAVVVLIGQSVHAPAEECLTDWGTAGEIVRREKLMSVQDLSKIDGPSLGGQIVKTTLCKDGDDYVYKIVVRAAGGVLKTIVVDARPVSKGQ